MIIRKAEEKDLYDILENTIALIIMNLCCNRFKYFLDGVKDDKNCCNRR